MKYFTKRVEFPELSGELLPVNTLWEYVSSSFLDGIINHYNIIGWFVVDRYIYDGMEFIDTIDDLTHEEKLERIEHVRENGLENHKLLIREFEDDIIFVGKSVSEENTYCFFYYDCDVSDCSIGRFVTDDSEEVVLSEIASMVKDEFLCEELHEMPVDLLLCKWVRFI